MKILFEENKLEFTELKGPLFSEKKVSVIIARLDKIHPHISGNKLFKLHYFLAAALKYPGQPVLTFGGAYSNHLVATSYACKLAGLQAIGIVRGEKPAIFSHTLEQCEKNGMQLNFISRDEYSNKDSFPFEEMITTKLGACTIIPEGGYHPLGANGAALIMDRLTALHATHICTAVGTTTTMAGLLKNSSAAEVIIGIPVLKGMTDIQSRISYLCEEVNTSEPVIFDNYHFGGYAKKNEELIRFMNEFYIQYKVPTDFIYTAKMMYAVTDKIKTGYFPEGSNIVCLHTGGLQGNNSLPPSTLVF